MIRLFFIQTLVLANLSFIGQETKKSTHVEIDGYKGKVQSVEKSNFKVKLKNGEILPDIRSGNDDNFMYKYDVNGNIIEEYGYTLDWKLSLHYSWTYNEAGNKNTNTGYTINGNKDYLSKYEYDEKGNLITRNVYNSDNSLRNSWHYTYDQNNNCITEIELNSVGNELYSRETKYDQGGHWIEENRSNNTFTYKAKYDEKGNRIELSAHLSDGKVKLFSKFVYDSLNRKIQEFDGKKKYIWFYDPSGKKTEYREYKKEKLILRRTFKYDEHGHEVEAVQYNSRDKIEFKYSAKREYDNIGNIIKIQNFKNDVPTYLTLFKFVYFE